MEKTQILIAHQKQTLDRTKKGRQAAKKTSAKDTLLYDRSFLTIFPTSKFEINTENVYIFLTNHKYQYDQVFLLSLLF